LKYHKLGKTGVQVPSIIFGTSCFGNLYQVLPWSTKIHILKNIFEQVDGPVVLDTAGKYGAGLALESIGKGLTELGIPRNRVMISNKLGWFRVPLETEEPTFEPGVWKNINHDAVQKITFEGIISCFNQGLELLDHKYETELVSIHDPDEYLASSVNESERKKSLNNIIDAYKTLEQLKADGKVKAIGIGAKDWKVIKEFSQLVKLDWVMLAVSFTIFKHPPELLDFLDKLYQSGIFIINSAVFHAGFLTGGKYFDYRIPDPANEPDKKLFKWRSRFHKICARHNVKPADACVQFGMSHPGVKSISLNTSKPERVQDNIQSVQVSISDDFWIKLKDEQLIAGDYPYLG